MAASLSEIYPKRKLELEDITNRQKKAKHAKTNADYYRQHVQERSPSPSSPTSSSSSPPHHKHKPKSVSFELSRNEHYEDSPLLTPKEDDYVSDSERSNRTQQLDSNADYVALGATVDMLTVTKGKIEDDLAELAHLRKAAKVESKSALVDFYMRLICNDTAKNPHLPQQHRIVSAPSVDWGKYHKGLQHAAANAHLSHDCTNDYEEVFKGLKMFPN